MHKLSRDRRNAKSHVIVLVLSLITALGASSLELEVEDRGAGFSADGRRPGLGMVAMRERAELLRGSISFQTPASGGTVVRLTVPKESVSHESQEAHA